jgi:hypothetical protein
VKLLNKLFWYLKQLFPLTYWSTFESDKKFYLSFWKMWFGKCYDVSTVQVIDKGV